MTNRLPALFALLALAQAAPCFAHSASELTNGFGKQLLTTLEYVDYPDVLVAIAAGNTTPWLRYDDKPCGDKEYGISSCLYDRWVRASNDSIPSGSVDQELLGIVDKLTDGVFTTFRDFPIDTAGGDFLEDSHGHGFDQLTQAQFTALRANPMLVVTSRPGPNGTVYAKYRYPSAGSYTDPGERFKQYLSSGLIADLDTANANGALNYDMTEDYDYTNRTDLNQTFRSLNQRIVQELLKNYAYKAGDTPGHTYQRLISVHPFDDYNGRSTRVWYRRHSAGKPLFMMDFYCDLYCSQSEFDAQERDWGMRYARIVDALVNEQNANPSYPNFYQLPIYWQVAGGYSSLPGDVGGFAWKSKTWFDDAPNAQMIDHKEYTAVTANFKAYMAGQYPGLR